MRKPILFDITMPLPHAVDPFTTGIGRVERAWLALLASAPEPAYFFLEHRGTVSVLGPGAGQVLANWIARRDPADLPPLSRLLLRLGRTRAALRFAVMRHALLRRVPAGENDRLLPGLRRLFPAGAWFLGVSHRPMPEARFRTFRAAGVKTAILIHDTLPLDHPEWHFEDSTAAAALVRETLRDADLILCNSAVTRADYLRNARMLAPNLPPPPAVVAHLGLHDRPAVPPGPLPPGIAPDRPLFMALGTIQPRKNLGLLVEAWDRMATRIPPQHLPQLVIAGSWGWKVEELRARLDRSPLRGTAIHVLDRPDDATVQALLRAVNALLMPSFAEGYGLPLMEVARDGIPVIASDLPVYREIAGTYPAYCPPDAPEDWITRILSFTGPPRRLAPPPIPTWQAHFATVRAAMDAT
ncbi:glycosyltransferase [Pseudogemmobacter blasticus]|uniref:Glycosyltransferase family 1 protein n=1 Tax=Fuscovulum blasticum DSM 2131 TaxID=1188250 RepID=A0A2T4JBV2_FUSBL|nr:glycosyltransferase [Fuscovulum blasticum]PTE15382.1 hypothetical protein C5F44_06175 [Fuscovulum blasticum DSM 2131]